MEQEVYVFSSKLDCVDDNDGRTVMTTTMTTSTMKNNDVCTTNDDAIDTNPMAKAHKFSVSHRKTETKRYDTETDCCFFPFFEVFALCTANCCCCCWYRWSVFVERTQWNHLDFQGKKRGSFDINSFCVFLLGLFWWKRWDWWIDEFQINLFPNKLK